MLMRRPLDLSESSGKRGQESGGSSGNGAGRGGEGKKRKNSGSQQGAMNSLEFGEGKAALEGKKGGCPCHPMKEATEGDCGKVSHQLCPQAINTVVAFSVVSPEIKEAIESVKYIAENMKSRNKAKEVK